MSRHHEEDGGSGGHLLAGSTDLFTSFSTACFYVTQRNLLCVRLGAARRTGAAVRVA